MGASKHKLQAISAQTREGRQHAVFHPNKSVACIRCVCVHVKMLLSGGSLCLLYSWALCAHDKEPLLPRHNSQAGKHPPYPPALISSTHTHRFLSHSWSGDLILCVLYDKAIRLQSLFVANYCMSFQVEFNYAISVFNVYCLSSGFITCCKHILGHIIKKKKRMSFQAWMSFFLMLNIEDILKGF